MATTNTQLRYRLIVSGEGNQKYHFGGYPSKQEAVAAAVKINTRQGDLLWVEDTLTGGFFRYYQGGRI